MFACLVSRRRQQAPLLQELGDDAIAKAEPCAGLRLAAERGQQAVIAAAAEDRAKLARAVAPFEHHACTMPDHFGPLAWVRRKVILDHSPSLSS